MSFFLRSILAAVSAAVLISAARAEAPLSLPSAPAQSLPDPATSHEVQDLPVAPEREIVADTESALRDGFTLLNPASHKDSPVRGDVESEIVAPMARKVGQSCPCEFDFLFIDMDGDNQFELVIFPRIRGIEAPRGSDGAAFFVYRFDGATFKPILSAGAMALGIRVTERGRVQLAAIQEHGYKTFEYQSRALFEVANPSRLP